MLDKERIEDETARVAERMRRAVLTLYALPDPDRVIRARRSHGLHYIAEAQDWPDEKPSVRKFQPSAVDVDRYLDDLGRLSWLGRQKHGAREVDIIMSRAHRVPWWRLAQKYGKTIKTVSRWYDGAIARLYSQFGQEMAISEQ